MAKQLNKNLPCIAMNKYRFLSMLRIGVVYIGLVPAVIEKRLVMLGAGMTLLHASSNNSWFLTHATMFRRSFFFFFFSAYKFNQDGKLGELVLVHGDRK